MRQKHNVTLLTAFVYRDIIDTVNLLDSTSTELRRNLSDPHQHLQRQRQRIDELKSTADNLEPSAQRMVDESRSKTNEFIQLREKILGEKPMNASSLSDRPLQMEFANITDKLKWGLDTVGHRQ